MAKTIQQKLEVISGTKARLKSKLGVPDGTPFEEYPSYAGGGVSLKESDVNFYDYDGTLVAAWSAEKALSATELPDNPDHSEDEIPLVSEGWNWSLANIQKQLTDVGGVVYVGQMYHTADGMTHLIVRQDEDGDCSWGVSLRVSPSYNKFTIDWGDGTVDETSSSYVTHVYAQKGVYDIKVNNASRVECNGTISSNGKYYRVTDIRYASSISGINSNAFNGCKLLKSITMPNSINTIDGYAFSACPNLKSLIIPNRVTSLLSYTFSSCYTQIIILPESVTSISTYTFSYASFVRSISIPFGITAIEEKTFNGCEYLPSIAIPKGVTRIGSSAFNSCTILQSITIPSSVTTIGSQAFTACIMAGVVYAKPLTPPTLVNTNAFPAKGTYLKRIIVPKGSLSAYQSETNWSSFADIMVEAED